MIRKTFIPKIKEYAKYFTNDIEFDGDITKEYTCSVVGSNLPTPKIVKFITKVVDNIPVNFVVLQFEGRCANTQMTLEFNNAVEVTEAKKVAFFTWLGGYLTWLNFLFRWFSLKTLKKITIGIAILIMTPVAIGVGYTVVDFGYEYVFDESLDDSDFIKAVDEFRFKIIGIWVRDNGLDKAGEFGEFIKDKAIGAKEKVVDIYDDIRD